jgi:sigma-B regulation protein RsbU (phosphoserine phosphatase)
MNSSIINLESLLDLAAKLNDKYDSDFILNSALLTLMGKLKINRGAILLPGENGIYHFNITKGRQKTLLKRIELNNLVFDGKPEEILTSNRLNHTRKLSYENKYDKLLIDSGYHYLIPINNKENTLAIILLNQKIDNTEFLEDEFYYINLVVIIASISLQNTSNYESLKTNNLLLETKNQLLSAIFEMSQDFSTLLTKPQILKMISYRLMGQLLVNKFAIYLLNDENHFEEEINRFAVSPMKEVIFDLSRITELIKTSNNTFSKNTTEYLTQTGTKIISPLIIQGKTRGFFLIGKRLDGVDFTEENLLFITALSNTAISSLENERLFHEELLKKQMQIEMGLAFEIQKNLLPKTTPILNGYQIKGISLPSQMVSGDYFDFIKINNNKVLISIADVSGKGIPAAILMANIQAALRALAPLNLDLVELVSRINKVIYDNTTPDKFVTFFVGILDTELHEFKYVNAGHNPPLLSSNGRIKKLDSGGLVLGILEVPFTYSTDKIQFQKDDMLVFYTDGVTESLNINNIEFGESKFYNLIKECSNFSADEIIDKIVLEVDKHSADVTQTDDITIISLKRTS